MQTPNRNTFRVVISRDSHLKGCTKRINNYLNNKFRTFGWIKPGALAEEILDRLTVNLVNLKKRDCDKLVLMMCIGIILIKL
jgi:hypothetical protein